MITFDMDLIIQDKIKSDYENNKLRRESQDQNAHVNYYSMSQVGTCIRRQYYNKMTNTDILLPGLRNITLGNIIQDWSDNILLQRFGNDIVKIERTVTLPVPGDYLSTEYIYLTGRIDHLFTFRKNNNSRYYYPIEAKYLVNKLVKHLDQPKQSHLIQLMLYMTTMGADNAFLYYIDHTLTAKTFDVKYDQELVNDCFDRVRTVHDYIEQQVVPPAEALYSNDKWLKDQCWWCSLYSQCKNEEEKNQVK